MVNNHATMVNNRVTMVNNRVTMVNNRISFQQDSKSRNGRLTDLLFWGKLPTQQPYISVIRTKTVTMNNKMKKKNTTLSEQFSKSQRVKLDTHNTQIYNRSLSQLDTRHFNTHNTQIHDRSLSQLGTRHFNTPNTQIHDGSLSQLGTRHFNNKWRDLASYIGFQDI